MQKIELGTASWNVVRGRMSTNTTPSKDSPHPHPRRTIFQVPHQPEKRGGYDSSGVRDVPV